MGPGVKKIVNHEYLCKDIQPEGDSQRAGLGDEPRAAKQRRAGSVPPPHTHNQSQYHNRHLCNYKDWKGEETAG